MQNNSKKRIEFNFDFILFITVLILLSIGIVMVLSASSPQALSESGNSYTYVTKQAILGLIGIGLMLFISTVDYRKYMKFAVLGYIFSIIISLAVAIPTLGAETKGATRWLDLGFISFQPSEIAKILLIIFYAALLTKYKDKIKTLKYGFIIPFGFIIPVALILVLLQDHLSVTLLIIMVISIMMLMAGTRFLHFFSIGSIAAIFGAGGMYAIAKITGKGAYRIDRLTTFLNPWSDPTESGWQIIQSLYAIGSGGLFGVGLGDSKQKYLYIPEPHNDFIFAILGEEIGFIGCAIVIILFAIFIWRGLLIAMKAPDMFGSLLAVGITSLVGLQAIMNIAVVTSSMPNTGIPLPFFSYGGTALVILLCAVGILLNISKSIKKA